MMLLHTLKQQLVCSPSKTFKEPFISDWYIDDVRDIYERAEGHELVVEGLREGQNLVAEE